MSAKTARPVHLGLLGAAALLIVALIVAVLPGSRPAAAGGRGFSWVTSWSASAQVAAPGSLAVGGFDDRTVRDIIFASVGGDPIRLELTNAFGSAPLRVGRVTVAVAGSGAAVAGQVYPVTFGGRASFQIPAGAQVISDPVAMRVWPLEDLAVSVYLPGRTGRATFHSDAQQVNWVSAPGDHAADRDARAFTTATSSWYYLSGLIVRSPGTDGTVVVFGDSITDGFQSTVGRNDRWPDDLARRLDALDGPTLSVADEGISGNRVLRGSRFFGASAEARFRRDVLDQPGVRDVIVLEGINDIGFGPVPPHPGA